MKKKIQVVDLFCGIWWLSYGFVKQWFDVVAGIDFEESCKFAFEENNKAKFITKDIRDVTAEEINALYDNDTDIRILVWCAPCQPFSLMNTKKWQYSQEDVNRKSPIHAFARLIKEVQPDIVSMENVPGIAKEGKYESFKYFMDTLEENDYDIWHNGVVDCTKYWIAQTRKRFVLLAAKKSFGKKLAIVPPTHLDQPVTLREVIWDLEPIKHGEQSDKDRYHKARSLNALNLKRIKAVKKNWWSLIDVSRTLWPDCYKKESWKTYVNTVYGRMFWDKPAPTMTTFCTWYGNGRFGHPDQDRAISLREAALIQTFPENYKFVPDGENVAWIKIAKQIGNAVPVRLGEVIAESIDLFIK